MENKKGDWWFPSKGGTITVEPAVATGYRTVGIRPRSPPFPPPARPIAKTEVTGVNDTFGERSRGPFHTASSPLRGGRSRYRIKDREDSKMSSSYIWDSGSGSPLRLPIFPTTHSHRSHVPVPNIPPPLLLHNRWSRRRGPRRAPPSGPMGTGARHGDSPRSHKRGAGQNVRRL